MFVLGFHFPAEEGNKIADEKVIAKLDEKVVTANVKAIKLKYGKKFENETLYEKTDTFLAKALINYYQTHDDEETGEKYLIYTDRYQMSELSKRLDSDTETLALCKQFDSMDMYKLELV